MAEVNHKERAHALLSASSASRWMACTPSAVKEDAYEDQSSEFAKEGELAHELAELKLRSKLNMVLAHRSTDKEAKDRCAKVDEILSSKYYSKEMDEHTTSYVDYVIAQFLEARRKDPAAVLLIETRLDFSHIVPEGFGTGDALVIGNGSIEVIDLKYGAGVRVSAYENKQMKLYGVGAVSMFDDLYGFDAVALTVFQPRMDNISTFNTTYEELNRWANDDVAPIAEKAFKGEGELVPGDHCGFCKHKVKCSALLEEARNLFAAATTDPIPDATDEDLLEVYKRADRIAGYLTAVAAHILSEALSGKKWEGFKLVEGRSVRTISDTDKAEEILKEEGFGVEDIYTMKLKGLGDLEKLVGKKRFTEVMSLVISKPAGRPTLAPESDKRPALNLVESAAALFGVAEDEEEI